MSIWGNGRMIKNGDKGRWVYGTTNIWRVGIAMGQCRWPDMPIALCAHCSLWPFSHKLITPHCYCLICPLLHMLISLHDHFPSHVHCPICPLLYTLIFPCAQENCSFISLYAHSFRMFNAPYVHFSMRPYTHGYIRLFPINPLPCMPIGTNIHCRICSFLLIRPLPNMVFFYKLIAPYADCSICSFFPTRLYPHTVIAPYAHCTIYRLPYLLISIRISIAPHAHYPICQLPH